MEARLTIINYLRKSENRGATGRLLAAIRRGLPQMVGSRSWLPEAALYLGLPADDLDSEHARRGVAFVNRFFMDEHLRAVLAAARTVVVHASAMGRWLERIGLPAPALVVSPGFDPAIPLRQHLPARFTIGLLGADCEAAPAGWQDASGRSLEGLSLRGTDRLLEVARHVPAGGTRFLVDASHAKGSALADGLRALGHQVRIAPPEAGRAALYAGLDCLLIASRSEGGPCEGLDALAAGVPVVSTPVGEMPEVTDLLWSAPEEAVLLLERLRRARAAAFETRTQLRARVAARSRETQARVFADLLERLRRPTSVGVRSAPAPAALAEPSRGPGWPTAPRLVSVLMTAWRTAAWIEAAMHSILTQELPEGFELELLVAADGCAESLLVARRVDDPRVLVVELAENGGTYRALNTLLGFARGEFIAILDSDDIALPGRLAAGLAALDANPALDYVGTQLWRGDGELHGLRPFARTPPDPVAAFRAGRFYLSWHVTLMTRRRLFDRLGGYDDTRVSGDLDLVTRALGAGLRGRNLGEAFVIRRQRPGQLTRAPETGVGSELRRVYEAGVQARAGAYRAGSPVAPMTGPKRTPIRRLHGREPNVGTLVVMPTIPDRSASAAATLRGLLAQGPDAVIVFLNGHDSDADLPKDRRITYHLRPAGTGPAVRFDVDGERFGSVLFVDDDLVLPPNYLATAVAWLERLGSRSAISFHGRYWPRGATRYAERRLLHFALGVDVPVVCPYVGVGVSAVPGPLTRLLSRGRPPIFARDDDLWFSARLRAAGVRLVRPPTPARWIGWRSGALGQRSLYEQAQSNRFQDRQRLLAYVVAALGFTLDDRAPLADWRS